MKPNAKLQTPSFELAETLVPENPTVFKYVAHRKSLRGGDLVAVSCAGEKMMVNIYRTIRGRYFGRVIFETKLEDDHGLRGADRIKFGPEHVGRAMRAGQWLR